MFIERLWDRFRKKPKVVIPPHEITMGVAFKPFENATRFCIPGEGDNPLIPEAYTYTLALRREVRLSQIPGVIDVITDDPNAAVASILTRQGGGVEKLLGEAYFESIYSGKGKERFTERPTILRFAFLIHSPKDYAKLLNTYAEVKLGEEQYLLVWNQSRPTVKKELQALEGGSELLVVEKNLFNVKEDSEEIPTDGYEELEFGRVTFVWLPHKLEPLRTIEITYHQVDGGDGDSQPNKPPEPEVERMPVLV